MKSRIFFACVLAVGLALTVPSVGFSKEVFGRVVGYRVLEDGIKVVDFKTVVGNVMCAFRFPPNSAEDLEAITQPCPHPEKTLHVVGYIYGTRVDESTIDRVRCVTWAEVGSRPGPEEPYWDWPADPVPPIPADPGGPAGGSDSGGIVSASVSVGPTQETGGPGGGSGSGPAGGVGEAGGSVTEQPEEGDGEAAIAEDPAATAEDPCPDGSETFTGSGGIVNGNLRIGERFDILEISPEDADEDLFSDLREAVRSGETVVVTFCRGEGEGITVQSFSIAE